MASTQRNVKYVLSEIEKKSSNSRQHNVSNNPELKHSCSVQIKTNKKKTRIGFNLGVLVPSLELYFLPHDEIPSQNRWSWKQR